jgi:hypothetical protein
VKFGTDDDKHISLRFGYGGIAAFDSFSFGGHFVSAITTKHISANIFACKTDNDVKVVCFPMFLRSIININSTRDYLNDVLLTEIIYHGTYNHS